MCPLSLPIGLARGNGASSLPQRQFCLGAGCGRSVGPHWEGEFEYVEGVQTVLITGASRGIGRATTMWLAGRGWHVYAGVRSPEDGAALGAPASGQITPVQLDITDDEQVAALVNVLPDTLNAVVNNAGVVVAGPVEAVPVAELRRQLEINVVGQAAVTQAVLPRLRFSRGRLVFVSSVSGLIATPMFGPYSASKFALEAMVDALRMELAPWGIRVALVEPAQTDTDLWRHAEQDLDEAAAGLTPAHRELYAKHIAGFRKTIPRSMSAASPADGVAATIEKALTASRPRARYVVGAGARAQAILGRAMPTLIRDVVLRFGAGVPRKV
jgi:NAD(P)-dependent dehydrogenase (short-subunit alcohol dehydrogenase family)